MTKPRVVMCINGTRVSDIGQSWHPCCVLEAMLFEIILPSHDLLQFQQLFPTSFTSISSDNFRGDFLAMIYRASSDRALAESLRSSWAAEARSQFEFESFALPFTNVKNLNETLMNSFGNFFRSDHYNFWFDNIPAIFLTDSGKQFDKAICKDAIVLFCTSHSFLVPDGDGLCSLLNYKDFVQTYGAVAFIDDAVAFIDKNSDQ